MLKYLINGKIVTMTGSLYSNGYIRIENNKISQVGKMSELNKNGKLPFPCSDTEVIDVKGRLVMPGLIEAHCHMGITEQKKGMEGDDCNENIEPVTPYLRAIDAINPMDAAFGDAVRAGITSAMIGPGSSNPIGGQFVFMKTKGRRIDDLVVLAPAAMKIAFGENPKVNFLNQKKMPVTRMGIAALIREELMKAEQYCVKRRKAIEQNGEFDKDFKYECWVPVFERKIPLKAHVHRADDIFTAIRIAKEFNLRMTLDHCSEGHLIADELAKEEYPAIIGPDLSNRNKIEVQNMAFKTAGILNEHGIKVAITTDHPVSLIQYLPICAGFAAKAGLSEEDALKAITIRAAQICNVADRVGSLEVGKDADIAVFDGSPLEASTRTYCTIIDGDVVYMAEDE
ncbi:MAG: amidohydrolase [Clostridiales bacterium]|nr:amidohydrolase [Clostridiales bacterium]